jgi:Flp pilus assembly protein TadG
MLKCKFISRSRKLVGDESGVSAVEFALVAPVMLSLFFGVVAISDGVAVDRKLTIAAAAVANLAAQSTSISTTEMTNMINATSRIITPYDSSKLRVTITCIAIDANRNARVKWSYTPSGTARSGTYTFDSANSYLNIASTYLLLGEAAYDYTPIFGYGITGMIPLSDKMFMSPRISAPAYNGTACT